MREGRIALLQGLIIVVLVLESIAIGLLLIVLRRSRKDSTPDSGLQQLASSQDKMEKSLRDEMARNRQETTENFRLEREELGRSFNTLNESHLRQMGEMGTLLNRQLELFSQQLSRLTMNNEQRLESMRQTIEERLTVLQQENSLKLEQMRSTVDERLHSTLEARLGESFKMVSERLELVHQGLGEMQALASGVGDLKKVLSNVKTRGIWGEIQLGNILEQVLTSDQYATNVITKKGSSSRVEYAIKLPGQGDEGKVVWLPIDAKFPQEDYLRLVDATEIGDQESAEEAAKQLEYRIKSEAKKINEKYLDPPNTTDFAIMFLPTEGLYAEVIRRPGLIEEIQRTCRVNITGPSTIAALLNSLSMGFRTLAIQKRSSEVWILLRAIKTDFGNFGEALNRTQKKLHEASRTIERAAGRSRRIERKLKSIETLPSAQAELLLKEISEADETE